MKNNATFKKQIIYRSTHRGSKEMDLLIGNFVKTNINFFNDLELQELNKIVHMEDEILQKWYFTKNNENLVPVNKISKMLKKFKL